MYVYMKLSENENKITMKQDVGKLLCHSKRIYISLVLLVSLIPSE